MFVSYLDPAVGPGGQAAATVLADDERQTVARDEPTVVALPQQPVPQQDVQRDSDGCQEHHAQRRERQSHARGGQAERSVAELRAHHT